MCRKSMYQGITEIATDSWKRSCKSKTITNLKLPQCPFIPEIHKMIRDDSFNV